MPVKVGVNGYGTIGKRVADALRKIEGFKLIGIAKYTPDYSAVLAAKMGVSIYTPREKFKEFKELGVEPAGTVEELVESVDLMYDASPAGWGIKNKELYTKYKKPAVFQGGEAPNIAEVSYSTLCNYEQAVGKRYVRIVSCNTTGILRILCSLNPGNVESVFGVIIRRASDPREDVKGPVNSIALDPPAVPSHHAKDVATVIGDKPPVKTASVAVPTTLMHVQILRIELKTGTLKNIIVEQLEASGRVLVVNPAVLGLETTGRIVELSRDASRPRNDIYENIVFDSMLEVEDNTLTLVQAIHQESIVIPENIDVAYAILNIETDPIKVVERVNRALGVGGLRAILTRTS